ncbi:branched-chain amino acid ABC transporter permease [Candidatus Poriferisodalis sp.]|uniref:branched-chain amino acid ABC transporter permease n=1 Tax=Candidatus Poriferisodalis sp. TaxID=3101277 RepID=UPI003B019712
MTELAQNVIDGLGRGSIYALLALGIAVIFGVMHLLNFAHGELITVSGYVAYWVFSAGLSWYWIAPLVILVSVGTALAIEQIAFRWVRGAADFTMLLTSFGVHFVVQALFFMYVSASVRNFDRPRWITNTFDIGPVTIEVFDVVVIAVTALTLAATAAVLQRTMFGLSLRAAAEDFDAARLMGVKSDRVIRGAFALSGVLAGIAAIFWLMRAGQTTPSAGITPMLKGVLAALIGGLGSLRGAVLGGLVLGLAEVLLRSRLPDGIAGLTDGVVFVLIALLFIFRPGGLITVSRAERV